MKSLIAYATTKAPTPTLKSWGLMSSLSWGMLRAVFEPAAAGSWVEWGVEVGKSPEKPCRVRVLSSIESLRLRSLMPHALPLGTPSGVSEDVATASKPGVPCTTAHAFKARESAVEVVRSTWVTFGIANPNYPAPGPLVSSKVLCLNATMAARRPWTTSLWLPLSRR